MTENTPVPVAAADGEPPKISKKAAKKAEAKAAKAERKAEHAAADKANKSDQKDLPVRPKKDLAAVQPAISVDHDPMDATFKVGWLKEVYGITPPGTDVVTRFPPEPNGFLHIGHAKAIAVNFGFAKFHGGKCYLRYDDTNPEKEEERYFTSIKQIVEWLGYTPYDVTHSSDRFDRLYELAEILIQRGYAYVCHCSKEEIQNQKGGKEGKGNPRYECSHRNRPTGESLKEFRRMRDGEYAPKAAVLRMKMDLLGSGNPYMWDMAAYRIPDEGKQIHHRTKDKWLIYPTYDFTHCLCDAMERISHSLCTVEFRTARESYDWLVDKLQDELPAIPQQREYGRLNITGTVLSKRKIQQLVVNGIVRDWDDPRLYTLIALRRRGVPPGAIRAFVAELGVSDATTAIQLVRLETVVRKYLERTTPRLMLVPDPILVIIDNLPADHYEAIELDYLKGGDEKIYGRHTVPFSREVFIDRSDFRAEDSKDFFRLAPGKSVGLLNVPYPVLAHSFTKDEATGLVTEIRATYLQPGLPGVDEEDVKNKPKAYIQWVANAPDHGSPLRAEVRIFRPLFKSENPDGAPGGFIDDVNPKSEDNFPNAVLETGFEDIRKRGPWPKDFLSENDGKGGRAPGPWDVRFQGVRVAYFAVDRESVLEPAKELSPTEQEIQRKIVLNQIVPLKEDTSKG